jgi:hypothetical protein
LLGAGEGSHIWVHFFVTGCMMLDLGRNCCSVILVLAAVPEVRLVLLAWQDQLL